MNAKPFVIPRPVGALISLLPQYPPSVVFAAALNFALGRMLPKDALAPLYGRRVCLRTTDAGVVVNFTLTPNGFTACLAGRTPDLTISASAHDFLMLALRREDPDTLFFNRRLVMEGDTELGLLVKNTLDGLDLPAFDLSTLSPRRVISVLKSRLLP
ncbi:MAG: SCP2 sterol-binding domain-containing protein [Betaproteobacteria bacterium]|nr:SCP2 sterol-binding domain-containing protein [Betaproteobacteria bacterium]